jgi:tripartite-type tricarboxylate transporter receptor subunit TctC
MPNATSGFLTRRRATLVAGLAALISWKTAWIPATALAQGYPVRPVQVVVTFAAGGGVDLTTRLVTEAAGEILGQRLVIENRGGAATVAGSAVVARAEPDGYTLLAAPPPW